MNLPYRWIECASWELDFFGLPHRIPWPADVDEEEAKREPFELGSLLKAIELMGPDAGTPWTGFLKAATQFGELTESLEDSEISRARELLVDIERHHPGTSFRIFHEAYVARHEGRLTDAIALYQQAAEKTPSISEIWNNMAMLLAMSERRDEAVSAFRKALENSPQNRTALEGLAQMRELVKLIRDPNDPNSAMFVEIPTFRDMATQQIPTLAENPENLINFGEELFRTGIIPEVGVMALEKAHELQPDQPRSLVALASAYRLMGELDKARTLITRLTELAPDSTEAFFHLAQICNAMGDSAAERAALQRVLEINPNQQAALGIWFELKPGEHDPAKEQQLLDFSESRNSWMALILASALCRERADFGRAMQLAERACQMAPDSEEALLHFSATIGDARDVTRLARDIKPKVESGKFSKRLDWNYAHVLHQLGLTSDAINALKKAASEENAPDDFKAACSTSIEAWSGILTGSGIPLEVHSSGVLLRDVLLKLEDDDGGVILKAGSQLPEQGVFPWRANGSETSVILQQGQSGGSNPPKILGEFKVRGIQAAPGQPVTIECHLAGLPDGALHFRAAQNGRRLGVGWAPAAEHATV
jgi:tetratricopeptide (TPR) repeat protein